MSKLGKKVGKRPATFKTKAVRKRLRRKFLTLFAVLLTLWPLAAAGLWVFTVLKEERPVHQLTQVQRHSQLSPFNEGIVTVTFDDGWQSAYKNAAPILSKYNIPTTFYNISGTTDNLLYMSAEQVKSLQETGHEIDSHSVSHPDLTDLPDAQLAFELSQSKVDLEKITHAPVDDFSSPLSAYDENVVAAVKAQGYRSHRTTDAELKRDLYNVNTKSNFDIWHIQAYTVRQDTTLEQLRDYLAFAKEHKAWVILVYHQIEDHQKEIPDEDKYAISTDSFEAQMKAVNESGLKVATMDAVLDIVSIMHLPAKRSHYE